MKTDYHIHTQFSDDSEYLMEAVVLDAIQLKIEEICFTDHVDYGIKRDVDDPRGIEYRSGGPGEPEKIALANVDYDAYDKNIRRLQQCYGDRISIKMGLEFGMQVNTIPQYEALFAKYLFDFILLSVHQVDGLEFWTQEFQTGHSQQEYNERYYQEVLEIVKQYRHYSVLAHLDLISRYDKQGYYPFEKVKPLITEILKCVITAGKGIEVNTSCYRYGLSDLTPSREILKLYKELGGSILTIGSDSHKKEHLGYRVEEIKSELIQLGFTKFCTFQGMEPVFHDLSDCDQEP